MMQLKQHIQTITSKEMDRREFLGYGMTVFLAAIGITGLLKTLADTAGSSVVNSQTQSNDRLGDLARSYGSSAYGR